jgi:phosphoenolpyruvate-protein kinase (PTS system EI component)
MPPLKHVALLLLFFVGYRGIRIYVYKNMVFNSQWNAYFLAVLLHKNVNTNIIQN